MTAKQNKKQHNQAEGSSPSVSCAQQGLYPGSRQLFLYCFLGGLLVMTMATFAFRIEYPNLMHPLPRGFQTVAPASMPPAASQDADAPAMPPASAGTGQTGTGQTGTGRTGTGQTGMPPMESAQGAAANPMAEVRALMATLEKDPNNYDALLALGERVMDIQAWDRAKELFNRALLVKPSSTPALNFLGIIDYHQEKYQSAAETFLMVLKKDPGAVMAHLNLGIIYWRHLDNPAAARTHLQTVLNSKTADDPAKNIARDELAALEKQTAQGQ